MQRQIYHHIINGAVFVLCFAIAFSAILLLPKTAYAQEAQAGETAVQSTQAAEGVDEAQDNQVDLTAEQEEELAQADDALAEIAAEQGTAAPQVIVKSGDIGVDVSAWQGTLKQSDWQAMKNAGVTFAILRLGWGHAGNGAKDEQFENNYAKAKAAGLSVGAYLYSYADDTAEAQAEADYAKSLLGGKTLDLPLAFDYEEEKIIGAHNGEHHAAVIAAFCERVRIYGYEPMLYANLSTLNKLPYDKISQYRIWVAQYNDTNDYAHPYAIWQYSETGSVKGVSGKLDMNKAATDFSK